MAGLYPEIERALAPHGLILRGGFRRKRGDLVPEGARSLLLIGNAGGSMWTAFEEAAQAGDHPLDRWLRSIVDPLAAELRARAVYPSDGPPYWPFQRWAMRAEPVHPSPVGILIHRRYGLWHAYRAALVFDRAIPLRRRGEAASPCETCADRPCLAACPAAAFSADGYDVEACRSHIATPAGLDCMSLACRARRACPVGREYTYPPAQARFHMAAFAARAD
jgi:hypothetical protein